MAQGLIRSGSATMSAALVVPSRASRRAFVVFAPASGSCTISDSPNITNGEGVFAAAGNPAVKLDQGVVGDLVKQVLCVVGSASSSLGLVEVLE
jgi:hypothetical protein